MKILLWRLHFAGGKTIYMINKLYKMLEAIRAVIKKRRKIGQDKGVLVVPVQILNWVVRVGLVEFCHRVCLSYLILLSSCVVFYWMYVIYLLRSLSH